MITASETFAHTCFLTGDKEVIEKDAYFYELIPKLQEMIETVGGKLVKL